MRGLNVSAAVIDELTTEQKLARARSSAVHPSAQAKPAREVDIKRAHSPLSSFLPSGSKYPRATVRPVRGVVDGRPMWVAKIWDDPCCPVATATGQPIVRVTDSRDVAWTWAQYAVDALRFWQEQNNGD